MVELKQVLNMVVITLAVAIIFTIVMGFVATVFRDAFGEFTNPFVTMYNAIRNLVVFILIFPVALSMIVIAFFGDLIISFVVPVLNWLGSPVGLVFPTKIGDKTLMEIVGTYSETTSTGLIGTFVGLINGIFPQLVAT